MLDLLNKDFKSSITNMSKSLKETMSKEFKESKKMMPHQIENVSNEMKILKRNKIEILGCKVHTEMKNSLGDEEQI